MLKLFLEHYLTEEQSFFSLSLKGMEAACNELNFSYLCKNGRIMLVCLSH